MVTAPISNNGHNWAVEDERIRARTVTCPGSALPVATLGDTCYLCKHTSWEMTLVHKVQNGQNTKGTPHVQLPQCHAAASRGGCSAGIMVPSPDPPGLQSTPEEHFQRLC